MNVDEALAILIAPKENNQQLGKDIEKKITEVFLKAGVVFFANPNLPLNLSGKKPPYQLNFVICYGGKLGMMIINLEMLKQA